MKTNLLALFCVFLLAISCKKDSSPTPSDINLKKGLLLYVPFDGSMADSSGNANPVTGVGGAFLTYDEHGNANSAFGATGSGERILVTNNGSIKFDTAVTLSANIMTRTGGRYGIMELVDNTNGQSYAVGMATGSTPPYRFDYSVSNHLATCGSISSNANIFSDTATFIPEVESWYNLIVTFHKGTLSAYVNGKLVRTRSGGDNTVALCPSAKVIIGGWWDGDPAAINGKIDEVRIYNRVLNADEIAELSKEFQ